MGAGECETVCDQAAPPSRAIKPREKTVRKRRTGRAWHSRWRLLHLLHVAFFNLLHEVAALEQIGLQLAGELTRDHEKLVVDHLGERDRSASGHEMGAPLKHEAGVPEHEDGKQ